MFLHMFSVYDSKVQAYMTPFFMRSRGEALRAFSTIVNEAGHAFNKHPADYTLFYLGHICDQDASFNRLTTPESLGMAQEFIVPSQFVQPDMFKSGGVVNDNGD